MKKELKEFNFKLIIVVLLMLGISIMLWVGIYKKSKAIQESNKAIQDQCRALVQTSSIIEKEEYTINKFENITIIEVTYYLNSNETYSIVKYAYVLDNQEYQIRNYKMVSSTTLY